MKHLILLKTAALLLITAQSFATVRIVDNNVNSPAPYSTIQDAINDSSPGDTVYVQGSPNNYGNITIDRRITLIGAGYNVTGTQYNVPANNQGFAIVFDSSATQNDLSGTKIIGIRTGDITNAGNTHPNYVTIDRCHFNGGSGLSVSGSNWIVKNCVVSAQINIIPESHNTFISNNLLQSVAGGNDETLGIVITNNFFYINVSSSPSLYGLHYANISNNVFWTNTLNSPQYIHYCVFNNNITYDSLLLNMALLPIENGAYNIDNIGSNNLNYTNPNFVNVPPYNYNFPLGIMSEYDFSYQSGSPAINAGTDGTDIGISGGAFPMTQWTGVPPIPQMQELNVLNAIIDQDQPLDINFKARKMD